MTSTFSTNKSIEEPAAGDYVNTWATPVNANWNIIDKAFGGMTSLNVTSVSGTVTLTATQYQSLILSISGTLTANVTYSLPSTVGGQWVVANSTTGAFTVTIASAGGGTSVVSPQGYVRTVAADGTNVVFSNNAPASAGGSTTQVQYNSSGTLAGSANLVWDNANTRLGIAQASPAYALDVTGSINATAQVRVGSSIRFSDASTQAVSASPTTIQVTISGGGSTISTGVQGDVAVPFNCTVTSWEILGDQSGSIVLGLWMDTLANYPPTVADTIIGSAPPTVSSATKASSSTLTGWTTALPLGSTIRYNVDSVTSFQRVTVIWFVTRT